MKCVHPLVLNTKTHSTKSPPSRIVYINHWVNTKKAIQFFIGNSEHPFVEMLLTHHIFFSFVSNIHEIVFHN